MSFRIRNHVQLVGRLGDAVRISRLSDDSYVANAEIYVDDALKDFDEESGRMFHLIGWGKMAESMHHHLGARNRIVVQGRLVNRPRTRNGVRFYRTEIRVSEFMVLRESEFRAQEVCLSPNSPT